MRKLRISGNEESYREPMGEKQCTNAGHIVRLATVSYLLILLLIVVLVVANISNSSGHHDLSKLMRSMVSQLVYITDAKFNTMQVIKPKCCIFTFSSE